MKRQVLFRSKGSMLVFENEQLAAYDREYEPLYYDALEHLIAMSGLDITIIRDDRKPSGRVAMVKVGILKHER